MPFKLFQDSHRGHLWDLIQRSHLLEAEFEGIDETLGFAVVQDDVCHFVYVKKDFRRQHIAKALLQGVKRYTYYTKAGIKLAKALDLHYNPYLAR